MRLPPKPPAAPAPPPVQLTGVAQPVGSSPLTRVRDESAGLGGAGSSGARRARGRWLLEGVALILLFGVAFEGACRIEDWIRYRTPLLSPYVDQSELVMFTPTGARGRPNARFRQWRLNELGMRGPSARAARTPGVARVVTAGASETFGLRESADREFPRVLEQRLREGALVSCPAFRGGAEVLNAALPGMSLPTVTQDIRHRLAALHPDVVVLYPTPVQYLDIDPPGPISSDTPDAGGASTLRLALRPRAVPRLREQIKVMMPGWLQTVLRRREIDALVRRQPPGWRFAAVPEERLAQYARDLTAAVESIHAIDAKAVVAVHANAFRAGGGSPELAVAWQRFYPRATTDVIVRFDSVAAIVTASVAAGAGATVVDLPSILGRDARTAFADYAHFTDDGAARVGAALAAPVATALGCDTVDPR